MSARYLIGDVFDRMAELEDGSVDLIVTSPPFLALRSYLPADHPDKAKEIGSEPTPAAFIDTMLALTSEWRRLLAPYGSIAVELGDTYAGSGGAGGDYAENGLREGQPKFSGSNVRKAWVTDHDSGRRNPGPGWPLAKSKTLIPELYRIALAYGIHPLTGQPSPAGTWRVRNVVTWCRPNPPVGALGDKWRPATSDIVVACVSGKRYWDDIATRRESTTVGGGTGFGAWDSSNDKSGVRRKVENTGAHSSGAPLLDYWEIPPGGYAGSHYAVYPTALVEPLIKAMAPLKVCVECGEPARRIVETTNAVGKAVGRKAWMNGTEGIGSGHSGEITVEANDRSVPDYAEKVTTGWTDCGHDNYRPALILDPFGGSGTTGVVGTGHDVVLIDIDERNAELARERIGPMFFEVTNRGDAHSGVRPDSTPQDSPDGRLRSRG